MTYRPFGKVALSAAARTLCRLGIRRKNVATNAELIRKPRTLTEGKLICDKYGEWSLSRFGRNVVFMI